MLSLASIYKTELCLERRAGGRTSQNLSRNPQGTHIGGFSDQPLLIVQNVANAAHQLHGAAVVRVLKESKSKRHFVLLHAMGQNLTAEQRARPQDGGDAWQHNHEDCCSSSVNGDKKSMLWETQLQEEGKIILFLASLIA